MPPTNGRASGMRGLRLRAVHVPVNTGWKCLSCSLWSLQLVSQLSCMHLEKAVISGGISQGEFSGHALCCRLRTNSLTEQARQTGKLGYRG